MSVRFLIQTPPPKLNDQGVEVPQTPEEYIEITSLDTKDVVCRKVREGEREAYPTQYAEFKTPVKIEPTPVQTTIPVVESKHGFKSRRP